MLLKVLIVLAFVPIILRAMNPSQSLNKKDGKSHRKSPRLIEMAAAKEDKKKTQQKLSPANKHRGNGGESSSSNTTNHGASSAMGRPQNDLRPPIEWADRSERHDSLLSLAEACAEFGLLLQNKESNSGKQNKSLNECETNIGRTSNAHNQNEENIGNIDEAITAQRAQSDDQSTQSPSKKRKRPEIIETSKNAKEKSHELANESTHSKNNSRETVNLMNSYSPNIHNHKPQGDEQQNDRIPEQITDSELQIERNLQQPHSAEPSKVQTAQKSIGSEAAFDRNPQKSIGSEADRNPQKSEAPFDRNPQKSIGSEAAFDRNPQKSEAPFDRNPQKSIGSEAAFDRNPQKSIGSEAPFDRNPQKSTGSDHQNDPMQEVQKSDELHTDQSRHSTQFMELDDKIKVHQQMTDQKQKHIIELNDDEVSIIELDDDDDDEIEDLQQSKLNSDQPGPSKKQNIKLESKSVQRSEPKVYYISDSDEDELIALDEHLRPLVQQNSKGNDVQMSDAEEDEMTVKPFNFDDDLLQLLSVQSLDKKFISQYFNKKSPNEKWEKQNNDRSPSTSQVQNPLVQSVDIQELNSHKKKDNSTLKPTSDKIQTPNSNKQQNANIIPMLELEKMQISDHNNQTAGAIPLSTTKMQTPNSNRQSANTMSKSDKAETPNSNRQSANTMSKSDKAETPNSNRQSANTMSKSDKAETPNSNRQSANTMSKSDKAETPNSNRQSANTMSKSDKAETPNSNRQSANTMSKSDKAETPNSNRQSANTMSMPEKMQISDSNRQNANAMDISISTTFISGSDETNRQMMPKKIEEAIAAACAKSIRAIGQNALVYGFLLNKIFSKTLNDNVEGLINVITASKDKPEYTSKSVIIEILESVDNSLIKEIMMEILAEDNEFGEKMEQDLNLLTDQRKEMHFLFIYVRFYRKLSNALKWGSLGNWTKMSADQPNNEQTIDQFLQWFNKLNRGLEQNLINQTNVQHYSNATEWFEKLGRLENAIELSNFGILLILSPDAWELFGVERPTKVKGLPEKIGRQKIFKQFDANCDLSSIEQIAQKTWITLDKMGNNVVLEKIKNIFTKMIIQMKQSNAETLSIKKPAKIILFLGILPQIHNELANSEFDKLFEPKLAEERANGLHFLAKCLEILDAECDSFEKGVQKELGDLAKLRKKHLECATKKRTKAEGKSADNPIEL